VLNAGNFGVSQSRKRTFIWAAAPGETLPAWPQPLTVFKSPQLCINLPGNISYKAVKDGKNARLRAVTVKDAIRDLPAVENGADKCAATCHKHCTAQLVGCCIDSAVA
jgi:DNA (cytosine-5)-methyltransferase 1